MTVLYWIQTHYNFYAGFYYFDNIYYNYIKTTIISKMDKECTNFSIKDVAISALGLSVALPWTEAIKGEFEWTKVRFAIEVTIIIAIIAIILNHVHIFWKATKDSMTDHPIKIFEAIETIW